MEDFTIVVIAFKRPDALKRLLLSLDKVNWNNDNIRLYISIDKDNSQSEKYIQTVKIAKEFSWKYGEKIVDCKDNNLGLKEHILSCGNLTNQYDKLIVLEDDILVSPLMYVYAKQVVEFYNDDDQIAGYGLYSFQRNPLNNLPFIALNEGTDVYFVQYACSWGQIWTKDKWNKFYKWYIENKNIDVDKLKIPENVKRWDERSWLKFHIIYTILNNKYFVYPLTGLTTNFSDTGTHNYIDSFAYQCTLYTHNSNNLKFRFNKLSDAINKYDAYFENICMDKFLNVDKPVCSDFYGEKKIDNISQESYLLSSMKYNYKILKEYALQMYPYEQNIINNIKGNDVTLYDISYKSKNRFHNKKYTLTRYSYRLDCMARKDMSKILKYFVDDLYERIKRRIKNKTQR